MVNHTQNVLGLLPDLNHNNKQNTENKVHVNMRQNFCPLTAIPPSYNKTNYMH